MIQRVLPVYGTLLQHTPENERWQSARKWLPLPVRGLNARILELVVGEVDEPSVRIETCGDGVRPWRNQQQSTAMAIDAYRRLCEDEPNDTSAWEALARLFLAVEQWSDLRSLSRGT